MLKASYAGDATLRLKHFKIWVQLLATVGLALAVVWVDGLFWQDQAHREGAIRQATGYSLSMHDATMAGLTGMMVTGTVAQRAVFLDQVRQLHQIRDVRVLRSEGVKRFFGPGTGAEAGDTDALEQEVMRTGKAVVRVRKGTEAVAEASSRIESGNAELSSGTNSQTRALQHTAESMAELTSTARQNAHNARQGNALVSSASQVASQGSQVVTQAIATMDAIQASSARMSEIVGVIDGIAFQTNILALNAAVEASRAGKQGRGFAVVAAEVRTLALRSSKAASEIKTLIGESVRQVDNGTQLVHGAGSTMHEITTSVQRFNTIMAEISAASLSQISGIEKVNQAMTQMAHVTEQNTPLADEAAAATQSLHEQAAGLEAVVREFKLDPAEAKARA